MRAEGYQHNLTLETARAGAMQVNLNQGVPAPPVAAAPVAVAPDSNPQAEILQRMQTLKMMLDQGLIDQGDFDARKKEILASI